MTQEAMDYLNEAMDYIQQHALRSSNVDWEVLRQETYAWIATAQTTAETYPAIRLILERLGDHHSFFREPEAEQLRQQGYIKQVGLLATYPEGIIGLVYPGSPAERAGVQVGQRIETINGQPITALSIEQFYATLQDADLSFTFTQAKQSKSQRVVLHATPYILNRQPQGQRIEQGIGYIDLPELLGSPMHGKSYAARVQQNIREIDQRATFGWVIDVRRNIGGNPWPMLAGVGPILGEGESSSFVSAQGKMTGIYQDGKAITEQGEILAQVDQPYFLKHPWPPVAVLTSQFTCSAAEFIVLAFRGRSRTRSFGEPTYGVPTGNDGKRLRDGALILLTTALGADRTGRTYDGPLLPDVHVRIDWTRLATADDPVLQAALDWLHSQECCP